MLKFSTFRDKRYLRTRYSEGRYLLASEASDQQLEALDLYRTFIKDQIGNVVIGDGWKIERLSDSELLVNIGDAWFEGLPFKFRDYKDKQVIMGVSDTTVDMYDYVNVGAGKYGKRLDFGSASADNYDIIISAEEQVVTAVPGEDPFLQNYNITETTAQKINIVYKINILLSSGQLVSPIPYTGRADNNYSNYIKIVTAGPGSNGTLSEAITTVTETSQKRLDGRNYIATIHNTDSRIPKSTDGRAEFEGGYLVDCKGSRYYIVSIQNSTDTFKSILYLDAQDKNLQSAPEIEASSEYYLYKKETFHATSSGTPDGFIYWKIASVDFSSGNFVHGSAITDQRDRLVSESEYQEMSNSKFGIMATQGGNFSWQVGAANVDVLSWSDAVVLISGDKKQQTIASDSAAVIDGGCIAYEMDLSTAGVISRDNVNCNIVSGTTTLTLDTFSGGDLDDVRIGNIIRLSNTPWSKATITAIDGISNTVTITPAFAGVGPTTPATIYTNSFAPEYVPTTEDTFILACRSGTKLYLSPGTELEAGEINRLGDGIPNGHLTFVGALSENDSNPDYFSTYVVSQGFPLNWTIAQLDSAIEDIYGILATPVYDERTLYDAITYPAGVVAGTVIHIPVNSRDSGTQKTFDAASGELQIFVNQLQKFQGTSVVVADWYACTVAGVIMDTGTAEYVKFTFNLPTDSEVHYRVDTLGGSGVGGGGGSSLQDAYTSGNVITTSVGVPFTVGGTAAKVAQFNGDIGCTGVIDPKAIEFTPQASNPLGVGQRGIWINSADEMVVERVSQPAANITQQIIALESGFGVSALSMILENNSGGSISAFTPVYSPLSGEIDIADGTDDVKSRIVGITTASIADGNTGTVVYAGKVDLGSTTLTHGRLIYLGLTPGELVDTAPTLVGGYPSGFDVVVIGVLMGTQLILRFQHMGTLG